MDTCTNCNWISRPCCSLQSLKVSCYVNAIGMHIRLQHSKSAQVTRNLENTIQAACSICSSTTLKGMQAIIMPCTYVYSGPYRVSLACYIQFGVVVIVAFHMCTIKGTHSLLTNGFNFQPTVLLCCVHKISCLITN